MKRYLLVVLLVVLAITGVSARSVVIIGPGLGITQENWSGGNSLGLDSVGLNLSAFQGDRFGIYENVSFSYIFAAQTQSGSVNLDGYDMKFGMDCLFGIGYNSRIGNFLSLVVGGGLYIGAIMLESSSTTVLSMPLGIGLSATLAYNIVPGLCVGFNLGAAYSFMDVMAEMESSSISYLNGLHAFGGIGIGYAL